MRSRKLFSISFLLALSALSLKADQASDATKQLTSAIDQALVVAAKSSDRETFIKGLTPLLNRYVSFETMTKRAVGPGWRSFSGAQQKKATELFAALIVRNYSTKFKPGERPSVEYQKTTTPAQGRVDVATRMLYQGSKFSVSYRLEQEGSWLITDVIIEGVSMIANYRGQLDSQFKRGGADQVINSLSQSLSKAE